ncbi:hypothetical protein GW17_00037529 [Ensete ventricosum]|nr:hypothetical protein GW17_00037529 [Ensete ventricosum]
MKIQYPLRADHPLLGRLQGQLVAARASPQGQQPPAVGLAASRATLARATPMEVPPAGVASAARAAAGGQGQPPPAQGWRPRCSEGEGRGLGHPFEKK